MHWGIRCFLALIYLLFYTYSFTQSNFAYDQAGRLVNDYAQGIVKITWNNQHKITAIVRADTSHQPDLEFQYGVHGNRSYKLVKPRNGSGLSPESDWEYTYYEYGPDGLLLATYSRKYQQENENNEFSEDFFHSEQNIIAQERVGYEHQPQVKALISHSFNAAFDAEGEFTDIQSSVFTIPLSPSETSSFRGKKCFSSHNHIRNIMAVVSDRVVPKLDVMPVAELISATDYYPFGMALPDRFINTSDYRYGMNKQERISEINENHYVAPYWNYDARTARRWNRDPVTVPAISPYATFGNNPIRYSDLLGDKITGDVESYTRLRAQVEVKHESVKQKLDALETRRDNDLDWTVKDGLLLASLNTTDVMYEEIKYEFEQLEKSSTNYHISTRKLGGTQDGDQMDGLTTTADGINIEVVIDTDRAAAGEEAKMLTLIHELKHAYQYENGEYSFRYNGRTGFASPYSILLEHAAELRESIFKDGVYQGQSLDLGLAPVGLKGTVVPGFGFTMKQYLDYVNYKFGYNAKGPVEFYKGWEEAYTLGQNHKTPPLSIEVIHEIMSAEKRFPVYFEIIYQDNKDTGVHKIE